MFKVTPACFLFFFYCVAVTFIGSWWVFFLLAGIGRDTHNTRARVYKGEAKQAVLGPNEYHVFPCHLAFSVVTSHTWQCEKCIQESGLRRHAWYKVTGTFSHVDEITKEWDSATSRITLKINDPGV